MFNELSGSKESSSSTMENANFNEVSKIVILYHILITYLLFFKHYSVDMTCIFVVLTWFVHAYDIDFCRRRKTKFRKRTRNS